MNLYFILIGVARLLLLAIGVAVWRFRRPLAEELPADKDPDERGIDVQRLASHGPAQVSASGFIQSFFNLVALPGERGKYTPWSSVAGRVNTEGGSMMVGIVLCTARPNAMGQLTVEHEGQWLDMLRIQRGAR